MKRPYGWSFRGETEIKHLIRIKVVTMRTIVCLILVCLFFSCSGSGDGSRGFVNMNNGVEDPFDNEPSGIMSFDAVNGDMCREDGKPVIRLFSTTWCRHCQWISDTFDEVVQTYVDDGLIVAHHWELDTGDDTLTTRVEQAVPDDEIAVFQEFNPQESIPTFVFGCKYYRIGTSYEQEDDLEAEAADFTAVIESLLSET
jgi:thiol-disulfide isomerase/thioredoxin